MSYAEREKAAQAVHAAGMTRVANVPEPAGQKFPCGSRVRIADDLGPMAHFPGGRDATVLHTYAHAYGGSSIDSYCLDVDDCGQVAWYREHQLMAI